MKKLLVLAAAVCALFPLTACGGSGGDSAPVTVQVANMSYSPASVTIEKGQTVEWIFDDNGLPHDVVADDGAFESELLTEGSFSHTFTEAGTFTYHCTPHPMMVGTVVVEG
ncbi:cupredoxin domain-containing protein [Nocardia fusca]|uniref:cupredoxin domain-containing protein n=1 Tax=Nocardia fusca TaxID=941183 RepID=UPI0007A73EF8|nr:cupredoxin family copper-binding protein [Nocardia fusca]